MMTSITPVKEGWAGLLFQISPEDHTVLFSRIDSIIDGHRPVVFVGIPQQVQHTLMGQRVGIITQRKPERACPGLVFN